MENHIYDVRIDKRRQPGRDFKRVLLKVDCDGGSIGKGCVLFSK